MKAIRGRLSVKGSDEVRQKDLYDSARFKGLLQWTMGSEQLWLLPHFKNVDNMISEGLYNQILAKNGRGLQRS